jgi:glycerol-3-phosphate cytidylyltransferase
MSKLFDENIRTVITYGTFDLFHIGHVRLLKRARSLGDRLIVAVSSDEFNAGKGKRAFFPFSERSEIVAACRYVDFVIREDHWEQKIDDIRNYKVKVFAMGDDWTSKFDFLRNHCEVFYLPRTPDISSSGVKLSLGAGG